MLIFILTQAIAQTTWTDSSTGLTYDWTYLRKQPDKYYKVIDYTNTFAPSTYNFNFDVELSDTCSGQSVTASETVELDGWLASCSILSRKGNQEVKSIENGVRVTLTGGDVCYSADTVDSRKLYIDLICDYAEDDWRITQSTYTDYCNVGIAKNCPAGCGYKSSKAWVWVIVLAILIGVAWQILKNYSKPEWVSGICCKDTAGKVLETLKNSFGGIVEKAKSIGRKNYEMV